MFYLETKRLRIIPSSLEQLHLLYNNPKALDTILKLDSYSIAISTNDFPRELNKSIEHYVIPKVKENQKSHLWFTHWLIIHERKNFRIGGLGFNGPPNKNGEVFVGYYIDRNFENQGLTTEALASLINWGSKNSNLQYIFADTLPNGVASQRVLQKNNFLLREKVAEGLRWRLTI